MTNYQYDDIKRSAKQELVTDLIDEIREHGLTVAQILELLGQRKKELSQPASKPEFQI